MIGGSDPILRGRWLAVWLLGLSLIAGLALSSCDRGPSVRDRDVEQFREVYRTGLEAPDAYVRAETLRLMERLGRRDLPGSPQKFLDDEDPMVRVAAIRALLATGHPDAAGFAQTRFAEANPPEKRSILEAVLEYGSEEFQRRLVWRALRSQQTPEVRRLAVEQGLVPWVREARDSEDSTIRQQLASNAQKYVRRLDRHVGGPILKMLLELDRTDAARPALQALKSSNRTVKDRLAAAKVLLEARAESATSLFRKLLAKARNQGKGDKLEVPEKGLDERLVRRAVLGVVAQGDESLVPKAKSYLEGASVDVYIEVLEALQSNPTEGARLALENAMIDARPEIRRRAIELYGKRDDAEIAALLDVAIDQSFSKRQHETRRTVARVLGRHVEPDWIEKLKANLSSSKGVLPALRLLVYIHEETGRTDLIGRVRESLVRVATSDPNRPAAIAAYLLIKLPDEFGDEELLERIESIKDPLPRYALLRRIVENNPSERIGYLLENFYPESDDLESFPVRLMSGAGLWLVRHPEPKESESGNEKSAPSS